MADPAPDRDIRPSRARRLLLIVAGLAFAFIVGFGWQWWEGRGYRERMDTAERELVFQRLATTLAAAVIQADRGSYDGARDLTSRFFTGLQENIDQADPAAATELQDILRRRDAVITALSRADPASEDVLSQMFVRYQVATGAEDVGLAVPAAGPDDAPGTGEAPATTSPAGPVTPAPAAADTGGPGGR